MEMNLAEIKVILDGVYGLCEENLKETLADVSRNLLKLESRNGKMLAEILIPNIPNKSHYEEFVKESVIEAMDSFVRVSRKSSKETKKNIFEDRKFVDYLIGHLEMGVTSSKRLFYSDVNFRKHLQSLFDFVVENKSEIFGGYSSKGSLPPFLIDYLFHYEREMLENYQKLCLISFEDHHNHVINSSEEESQKINGTFDEETIIEEEDDDNNNVSKLDGKEQRIDKDTQKDELFFFRTGVLFRQCLNLSKQLDQMEESYSSNSYASVDKSSSVEQEQELPQQVPRAEKLETKKPPDQKNNQIGNMKVEEPQQELEKKVPQKEEEEYEKLEIITSSDGDILVSDDDSDFNLLYELVDNISSPSVEAKKKLPTKTKPSSQKQQQQQPQPQDLHKEESNDQQKERNRKDDDDGEKEEELEEKFVLQEDDETDDEFDIFEVDEDTGELTKLSVLEEEEEDKQQKQQQKKNKSPPPSSLSSSPQQKQDPENTKKTTTATILSTAEKPVNKKESSQSSSQPAVENPTIIFDSNDNDDSEPIFETLSPTTEQLNKKLPPMIIPPSELLKNYKTGPFHASRPITKKPPLLGGERNNNNNNNNIIKNNNNNVSSKKEEEEEVVVDLVIESGPKKKQSSDNLSSIQSRRNVVEMNRSRKLGFRELPKSLRTVVIQFFGFVDFPAEDVKTYFSNRLDDPIEDYSYDGKQYYFLKFKHLKSVERARRIEDMVSIPLAVFPSLGGEGTPWPLSPVPREELEELGRTTSTEQPPLPPQTLVLPSSNQVRNNRSSPNRSSPNRARSSPSRGMRRNERRPAFRDNHPRPLKDPWIERMEYSNDDGFTLYRPRSRERNFRNIPPQRHHHQHQQHQQQQSQRQPQKRQPQQEPQRYHQRNDHYSRELNKPRTNDVIGNRNNINNMGYLDRPNILQFVDDENDNDIRRRKNEEDRKKREEEEEEKRRKQEEEEEERRKKREESKRRKKRKEEEEEEENERRRKKEKEEEEKEREREREHNMRRAMIKQQQQQQKEEEKEKERRRRRRRRKRDEQNEGKKNSNHNSPSTSAKTSPKKRGGRTNDNYGFGNLNNNEEVGGKKEEKQKNVIAKTQNDFRRYNEIMRKGLEGKDPDLIVEEEEEEDVIIKTPTSANPSQFGQHAFSNPYLLFNQELFQSDENGKKQQLQQDEEMEGERGKGSDEKELEPEDPMIRFHPTQIRLIFDDPALLSTITEKRVRGYALQAGEIISFVKRRNLPEYIICYFDPTSVSYAITELIDPEKGIRIERIEVVDNRKHIRRDINDEYSRKVSVAYFSEPVSEHAVADWIVKGCGDVDGGKYRGIHVVRVKIRFSNTTSRYFAVVEFRTSLGVRYAWRYKHGEILLGTEVMAVVDLLKDHEQFVTKEIRIRTNKFPHYIARGKYIKYVDNFLVSKLGVEKYRCIQKPSSRKYRGISCSLTFRTHKDMRRVLDLDCSVVDLFPFDKDNRGRKTYYMIDMYPRVKFKGRKERPMADYTVVVVNDPFQGYTDEENIRAVKYFFRDCGLITDVRICTKKSNQRHPRNVKIKVVFAAPEDAKLALRLDGRKYLGKKVVKVVKDRI